MIYPNPAAVEAAFYTAFANLDLEQMTTVWARGDEVSCIHPGGGLLRGTRDVLQSWASIFHGTELPRISHRVVHTSGEGGLAIHVVEEHVSSASTAREATVIATNVYRRTGDGWQMTLHHASLPLVENKAGDGGRSRPLH